MRFSDQICTGLVLRFSGAGLAARAAVTAAVVAVCGAGTAEAQKIGGKNVAAAEATAAFEAVCLKAAPNFPPDAKPFVAFGYDKPTKDPAVLSKAGVGFAGIGFAGREGGPQNSPVPNGCLVYVKDLDAGKIAVGLDGAIGKYFKRLAARQHGNDFYWLIGDFLPKKMIAFVAPKPQGTYAGHTLLMISKIKD